MLELWYNDSEFIENAKEEAVRGIKVFLESIEEVKNILEVMYPENWDLEKSTSNGVISQISIIIKFPEVTVTNRDNWSHTIYDFYFKIVLTNSDSDPDSNTSGLIANLLGNRGAATLDEIRRGYRHSHLVSVSASEYQQCYWSAYCTGSGEINSLFRSLNQEFNVDTLQLILLQLEVLSNWESIEGTPHILLKSVGSTQNYSRIDVNSSHITDFDYSEINSFIIDKKLSNIKLDHDGNSFKILESEELDNEILETAREYLSANPTMGFFTDRFIVYLKEGTEQYFTENESRNINTNTIDLSDCSSIRFRGETFPFRIVDREQELVLKQVPAPIFKQKLIKDYEQEINKYFIRKSIVDTYNTSSNQ